MASLGGVASVWITSRGNTLVVSAHCLLIKAWVDETIDGGACANGLRVLLAQRCAFAALAIIAVGYAICINLAISDWLACCIGASRQRRHHQYRQ
jgi:hypothetical protein